MRTIVVTINGKFYDFDADKVIDYEGAYTFYLNDVIVAEFMKNNIAGYIMQDYEEDEEDIE